MLTLPSNASTIYYPNKKPKEYKDLLPAILELDGTCELAIGNLQHSFNWPHFNEEHVGFLVSVKESETEKEKQKDQDTTGETPQSYFQAQVRLYSAASTGSQREKAL